MGSIRPRSFSEYAQMLWRRKLLFLSVAAATTIAAFFIINRLPDVYESQATVVVTGNQGDRQAIADRVAAVRERLTSRAFLESVAQRHLPSADTREGIDGVIDRLRKDTKVETTMRGDFPERLSLSYKNSDPQMAKDVATDLVSAFGNMNEALQKQLTTESESLNAELNGIENHLDELGKRRSFHGGSGAVRHEPDMNALRAERAATTASVESLTDKQFTLQREIAEQKRQIAEQQKLVKTAPSDSRSSSSYGVLLVRKAELEAQIKEYAAQYTDKNPKVIQAHSQLEEINHQIAKLNTDAQGGLVVNSAEARELRSMERELVRMETELEVTQRALDRKKQALDGTSAAGSLASRVPVIAVPSGGPSDSEAPIAGNESDRLKNRYDSLLRRQERLENERLTAAGLDPGLFQIVDMPAVPERPSGPNRLKLRIIALVMALGLALAVVVAFEIPRLFVIRDDRDVEYYLGAPVVVLIPETVTPTDHGRARRLLAMRIAGVLIVAAVLVPALIFLLNNLKIFNLLASH